MNKTRHRGFTLIELLAVITIVVILAALCLPAILAANDAKKFTSNIEKLKSSLNFARQEASSKNTFTWMFFHPSTSTTGEDLIAVILSSKDGGDPIAWGAYSATVPDASLELAANVLTLPQIRLRAAGAFTSSNISSLTGAASSNSSNDLCTTVSININVPGKGVVNFQKAVRFSPATGAANDDIAKNFIEFDLQPMKGSVPEDRNVAVFRIDGATGQVKIFRP